MKKTILILTAYFALAFTAGAVPAYPYPIKVTQPDGTDRTVTLHGDEYLSWAVDESGKAVRIDRDGWVRDIPMSRSAIYYNAYTAREKRLAGIPRRQYSGMHLGSKHFLVLLIEFSDVKFTVPDPQSAFSDMMNLKGYSENGATGSACDYYYDQSMGAFDPVFDVVGPVTVNAMATYGASTSSSNDTYPQGALLDACAQLDDEIDFSLYDYDGDGYVDNIFFYFAGYSEAEGADSDAIWPHAYYAITKDRKWVMYDGVYLYRYACAAELKGRSGSRMTSIGTFCHEFGHVLGLPDFYDTDYSENGESEGLLGFSLMSGGSYNNGSCTPPNLNAIERNMIGWMDMPDWWTEDGTRTVPSISTNTAFRTPSSNEGEYFIYEVRDGTGWDKYIKSDVSDSSPTGLVMYHVDRSMNDVYGQTAYSLWANGYNINSYAGHPCMRIVHADASSKLYRNMVFPGGGNVTAINADSGHSRIWDGSLTGYYMENISFADGSVTLTLKKERNRIIYGTVTDSSGNPLAGVEVTVSDNESSAAAEKKFAPGKLRTSRQVLRASALGSATTAADGTFSVNVPASASSSINLNFFKTRYKPGKFELELDAGTLLKNVVLLNASEGQSSGLSKYKGVSSYGLGLGRSPWSLTAGVYFSAEELSFYAGMRIKQIDFMFYSGSDGTAEKVQVFADVGEDRLYTQTVDSPNYNSGMSSQDISAADIRIPAGKEMVFGYALTNIQYGYPITLATDSGDDVVGGDALFRADAEETGGGWSAIGIQEDDDTVTYYDIIVSVTLESVESPFAAFGVKLISNPGGYVSGSVFELKFEDPDSGEHPSRTAWYFDGELQDGPTVVLSSGRHEVKAVCTYADGHTEEIVQLIEVQ